MKDLRSKLLEGKKDLHPKPETSILSLAKEPSTKKPTTGKGFNIYLLQNDEKRIDELDLFLRHQGIKTNRSVIMRAGLITLKSDQDLIDKVTFLINADARRTQ